jgi:hypothetical protein
MLEITDLVVTGLYDQIGLVDVGPCRRAELIVG